MADRTISIRIRAEAVFKVEVSVTDEQYQAIKTLTDVGVTFEVNQATDSDLHTQILQQVDADSFQEIDTFADIEINELDEEE